MFQFVNISAYRFVPLEDPAAIKQDLLPRCRALELKGTILLASEGINLFVAGTRESIDAFLVSLHAYPQFAGIEPKESLSDEQPFTRMLVRLKKEIISMGKEDIVPAVRTSEKISAADLKQWLDEGRDFTLLDVRNDYEVDLGTFKNAVPIGIDHFRTFPDAAQMLPTEVKQKPVVMFCTGGIRCEKAGPEMERQGFDQIFQLDGGILKYFETVGGEHYDGDCFVFDKRVAVDPTLTETDAVQCYACQTILDVEQQASPLYDPPRACPVCHQTEQEKLARRCDERTAAIAASTETLPGCEPYDNVRPMNVPGRMDNFACLDFLCGMHAHLTRDYWQSEIELDRIVHQGRSLNATEQVRAGWRVEHLLPGTVEPAVARDVVVLYEDEAIVAVSKPAPLPMHPCGRFNRNTLDWFLSRVFCDEPLRVIHRLDANTTGVVLFAKTQKVARPLHEQFKAGSVEKIYLARVSGIPQQDSFLCDDPISDVPDIAGTRNIAADGQPARTEFIVIARDEDEALIECRPRTGRTNQIRVHLASMNLSIVGDRAYGPTPAIQQTLGVDDDPMCLHAWRLKIEHPVSGEPIEFVASPPAWAKVS